MPRIAVAAVAIVLSASTVLAQEGSSDQETIRLLVQQVKELQEKVKALESRNVHFLGFDPLPTGTQVRVYNAGIRHRNHVAVLLLPVTPSGYASALPGWMRRYRVRFLNLVGWSDLAGLAGGRFERHMLKADIGGTGEALFAAYRL